jgi:hypothetical protein
MVDLRLDVTEAARFARMALDCVTREYPNKIAHVLNSADDVRGPRDLTPAFYGCYDWHSAVHGHWLLARVARLFPDEAFAAEACAAIARNITKDNIVAEFRYLDAQGRETFERPYGLAWVLALTEELRLMDKILAATLLPLAAVAAKRVGDWLEKLERPDRSGQHFNTAFALSLALDWARQWQPKLGETIERRARDYYMADRNAPVGFEPSGEDFFSPSLAEADLMRRVLSQEEFVPWLEQFLPGVRGFTPQTPADRSDGKLGHLDGLNLSRAWMLRGIATGLPLGHPRCGELYGVAEAHALRGLEAVGNEHYEGAHWLGTFAVYLLTQG